MERLIGAILLKAIDDWDDPSYRQELEEFLDSDWFQELVEVVHLDPVALRDQLRQGNYRQLSMRAAYR